MTNAALHDPAPINPPADTYRPGSIVKDLAAALKRDRMRRETRHARENEVRLLRALKSAREQLGITADHVPPGVDPNIAAEIDYAIEKAEGK